MLNDKFSCKQLPVTQVTCINLHCVNRTLHIHHPVNSKWSGCYRYSTTSATCPQPVQPSNGFNQQPHAWCDIYLQGKVAQPSTIMVMKDYLTMYQLAWVRTASLDTASADPGPESSILQSGSYRYDNRTYVVQVGEPSLLHHDLQASLQYKNYVT